jgi:hypothetical protein
MIEIQSEHPASKVHFSRLLEFGKEILTICSHLDITPILSGSLAVFGYSRNQTMRVNDLDLACSERDFPRLSQALEAQGIAYELKEWHVLQVRRDDLKVEFDSVEYWMGDLPEDYDTLMIAGCTFKVVGLASLRELYRRGLVATAGQSDADNRTKHTAIAAKYELLCSVSSREEPRLTG